MDKNKLTSFKTMLETIKETYGMDDNILAFELGVTPLTVSRWLAGKVKPQIPNYLKVRDLYDYVLENNISQNNVLKNKGNFQSKLIENIEKLEPIFSETTSIIEKSKEVIGKTKEVIEEPKKPLKVEEPKEVIEEPRKLEIINNSEDIFNDVRRVFYSRRLKQVFGMNASNILTTIDHWVNFNEKEKRNFHYGEYWCNTLLSVAYMTWFKYSFPSEAKFAEEVEKLLQQGLLIKKVVNISEDKPPLVIWRVDKKRLTELYNKKCSRLNQ